MAEEVVYSFNWTNKDLAIKAADEPSFHVMVPCPEKSINYGQSGNVVVSGDNLDALKLLRHTYEGKVKLIYIDPPYNTGNNHFVYADNFHTRAGTKRGEESDGLRPNYHINWLNMMYSRLLLAYKFLTDDGVIFISIDDVELYNLKKICDEIFGEANFVANIIWHKKPGRQSDSKHFSFSHDYILCFAKDKKLWHPTQMPRTAEVDQAYSNPDNDPRGPWRKESLVAKSGYDPTFSHTFKNGVTWSPPSGKHCRLSHTSLERLDEQGLILFTKNNVPMEKKFLAEVKQGLTPTTLWSWTDVGSTGEATKEGRALFKGLSVFSSPKPVRLLYNIIYLSGVADGDYVMDFFAGSGTTGHAVMKYNKDNGKDVKYILVQADEPCDERSEAYNQGYRCISDICIDRLKYASTEVYGENCGPGFTVHSLHNGVA